VSARVIAERGFHLLLQSCRGTVGSGGEFDLASSALVMPVTK
jgi:predicted acyl esterase